MINLTTKAKSYMTQANKELERVSDQLNTGQQINYGSQDRDVYARSLEINADLKIYENMQKHLGVAIAENNMTDQLVMNIKDNLDSFKSKLLQASTDTTTEDGREIIAQELKHLRDNIVDIGNSKMYGEYLFAGRDSTKAPFNFIQDSSGHYKDVEYVGDNEHREVVVDKGLYKDRGLNGIELFGVDPSKLAQVEENIQIMQDYEVAVTEAEANGDPIPDKPNLMDITTMPDTENLNNTGLIEALNIAIAQVEANNRDGMAQAMDFIAEDVFTELNNAHTELGLRNEFFEKSESRVEQRVIHLTKLEQDTMGVDIGEASIRLRELELMYNAMYATISKINDLSLVNYMK
jgi:flagellar hook-associated protein 3 FlgL